MLKPNSELATLFYMSFALIFGIQFRRRPSKVAPFLEQTTSRHACIPVITCSFCAQRSNRVIMLIHHSSIIPALDYNCSRFMYRS
jgi:hypothetical protein